MRKIIFDEIDASHIDKIRQHLDESAISSNIEGLYWVEITDDLLDEQQCEHRNCKPYRFAVELLDDAIHIELLIRSTTMISCDCIKFASPLQRDFILRYGDTLIQACGIKT